METVDLENARSRPSSDALFEDFLHRQSFAALYHNEALTPTELADILAYEAWRSSTTSTSAEAFEPQTRFELFSLGSLRAQQKISEFPAAALVQLLEAYAS